MRGFRVDKIPGPLFACNLCWSSIAGFFILSFMRAPLCRVRGFSAQGFTCLVFVVGLRYRVLDFGAHVDFCVSVFSAVPGELSRLQVGGAMHSRLGFRV